MANSGRIGILTFHYSTNFGGVLQSYALHKTLECLGIPNDVIDYVPSTYLGHRFHRNIGLKDGLDLRRLFRLMTLKRKYCGKAVRKFDAFRTQYMKLSERINESTLVSVLNRYSSVIVGSDQIWNPGQRNRPDYFLGFNEFRGMRISYAADSTTAEVSTEHLPKLTRELERFDHISVRNEHSQRFVETITGRKPPVVVDPTLLWDFDELSSGFMSDSEPYVAVYVLGKDIQGSNLEAVNSIKRAYGDLKVYAIVIPTMKFNLCDYADRVFYDLGPEEWLDMIRNATFVFTDSFHGTLFSLKFHRPFLAYYAEDMRATR